MKRKKNNLTEWLGILCIFSVFLDKAIRGVGLPFDLYYYYPIYIFFLISMGFQYGKLSLPPTWFNAAVFSIFILSFLVTWYNGLLGMEYVKQVLGITFSAFVLYNVMYVFEFNCKRIFDIYLKLAFFVALHGVIDNLLHILGIHLTPYVSTGPLIYREYGIMGEPFYLTMALTPAVIYLLCHFKRTWATEKFKFITILLCYLVTYSSIAVFGLMLGIFFSLYLNDFFNARKNKIVLAPLLLLPAILLINFMIDNVGLINARFTDTSALFFSSNVSTSDIHGTNSSTFALYSNFIISRDAFTANPLLGSGLGSHPLIFEKTFLEYFPPSYLENYGNQNQQDANSKFFRLMSETGLVGLILFLWATFGFLARKKKMITSQLKELGSINFSIFIYIILGLIRNGNYINIGFFLFFFLYYYTHKQINRGYNLQIAKDRRPI